VDWPVDAKRIAHGLAVGFPVPTLAGLDRPPDAVGSWRSAGIEAAEALHCREMGYDLAAARELKRRGLTPQEAYRQGLRSKIAIFDTFTAENLTTPIPDGERLTFGKDIPQTTRILLPRVEVIAIGTRGDTGSATSTGNRPTTAGTGTTGTPQDASSSGATLLVTVAVTQDEAERLVHAVQTGTLYLALLDDTSDVRPDLGITNKSLFS